MTLWQPATNSNGANSCSQCFGRKMNELRDMTNYNHYIHPEGLTLESGEELNELRIAYHVLGNPNADKTVWVCHALSGNSFVPEWWGGLFGEDKIFNFKDYKIVCANVIGSCYGSTGPDDFDNPKDFPLITIKDMVNAHIILRKHLQIELIDVLIGASLGGQQAVEWAISEQEVIKDLILVATNAVHSPLGKAFNETQRLALLADSSFGSKDGGYEGLKTARAIAMISYRSYEDFDQKQKDVESKIDDYRASSYVRYQGEKFQKRFKPAAYYTLSKAMDSHDVGRGRVSRKEALLKVKANTLVVGVNSDQLFPLSEQQFLERHIPDSQLGVINSPHGHDAFLINYDQLENIINDFLFNDFNGFKPTTLKHQIIKNEK